MSSQDRKLRILTIDDEEIYIHNIVGLLAGNYKIIVALSGREGLKLAQSNPPPDLILLDIMMPDMGGFKVCRLLKNDPLTRDIPVIFLSALGEVKHKTKGFEVGGVDYITKPFQGEEVLARVNTHLELKSVREILLQKNVELEQALFEIKELKGILPICSFCKKIRDDKGYWNQIEAYISKYSKAEFSHSMCPECVKEHYPDIV